MLDHLSTGRRENLPAEGCEFVQGAVCDLQTVDSLVGSHELSVHLAVRAAASRPGSTKLPVA